ncbi:MAG TPA: DNA helicase RecQ [Thermoanaerobaculia bacterium]|nr:DNA helicase RecQ [Thermoanaerobaculia bacterium]
MDPILDTLRRIWGFSSLRPLQDRAIGAVLGHRDSLVVMPTGGGKSLCYQLPPVHTEELTVVVSPLISLMKDQVDSLRTLGIEARQVNSSSSWDEKKEATALAKNGALRLLFVSPERLASEKLQEFLARLDVRTFAIDEAHCISQWGHDFRPEYRQLGDIRRRFPRASFHAYTATATGAVRSDIAKQLGLADPEIIVGSFDRPNLSYRVLPRRDVVRQTLEVLERHEGEAGIIYSIRRKDVDELTAKLRSRGIDARAYHAGLAPEERAATQEAFASEACNLVVATVAFGMGIDRSNLRFVLHTGLPKSIEHYQQETGRAGRDGLEADCVLLYSAADVLTWKSILQQSEDAAFTRASMRLLDEMDRFARGAVCRHRALVTYFGEDYGRDSCGACDLCLGDVALVSDAMDIAEKVLSCVVQTGQRFGIGHTISVLRGETNDRIVALGHDRVATYGILAHHAVAELRDWMYQLIGQGYLAQEGDRYPVLSVTSEGRAIMGSEGTVRLIEPVRKEKRERSKQESEGWEGVDRATFERLRAWRRELAAEREIPPYVIFGDRTLREIARVRPASLSALREIYGVGERKLEEFGQGVLRVLAEDAA